MQAFQERVVEEKKELDIKIGKLEEFTESESFGIVPDDERLRMTRQLDCMKKYGLILGERIAAFVP